MLILGPIPPPPPPRFPPLIFSLSRGTRWCQNFCVFPRITKRSPSLRRQRRIWGEEEGGFEVCEGGRGDFEWIVDDEESFWEGGGFLLIFCQRIWEIDNENTKWEKLPPAFSFQTNVMNRGWCLPPLPHLQGKPFRQCAKRYCHYPSSINA